MNFRGSHILSVDQFDLNDLKRLFTLAKEMETYARREKITQVLRGAVLGNLFFEPSTRSRVSFGAAFSRLGGSVEHTTGMSFSSMSKGESLYDTSRVVSGYVDVIVVRHPEKGAVAEFAAATHIPVINGGDGPGEHPTQALLDLYTLIKENNTSLSGLAGLRIAMVGDLKYGRTVHSLVKLLAKIENVEFVFIAPNELQLPSDLLSILHTNGNKVFQTDNLYEGISNVDAIYTTRIQQERFSPPELAEKYRGNYNINRLILEKYCKTNTIILHPLPRDSRADANELSVDLNTHPNLSIFRQTDNGIPVRMAIFALVLGVEDKVHSTAIAVPWYVPSKIGVHDTSELLQSK